jgi:hypothetical protein
MRLERDAAKARGCEMDSTEPSQQTPLDAERATLRAAGYTEHEISQILIAKAAAAPHATSGGLGVMSGALNNFTAALATARGAIPNMLTDIDSIFGAGVARVTRIKALVAFTFKAVLIGAIGFAVYQEWQQHIISATEIAAINARKAHYEECSAHAKAVIDTWTTGAWTQVTKDCALKEPTTAPPPASAKNGAAALR